MELPVVTGGMLYPWPTQCPDGFFTALTVARCASAAALPVDCHHITGALMPPHRPGPGQDHTAFWVMEATSLKRGVREAPSLQPITATAVQHCTAM